MKTPAGDIALYVHWPFCLSLCPYCDFNSHVRDTIDQGAWRDGLLRELEHYAARVPGRRLTSIFFGGGTPSLMPPETARAVIARARELFAPDPDLEITLEANPTSVEQTALAGFADAGFADAGADAGGASTKWRSRVEHRTGGPRPGGHAGRHRDDRRVVCVSQSQNPACDR